MITSRSRIAVCVAMFMSVALIATVVQQSETGILREEVSETAPTWSSEALVLTPEYAKYKAGGVDPESWERGTHPLIMTPEKQEMVEAKETEETPTIELAQWSIDRHLHKKQKKLEALEPTKRPGAVVKNLVELRALARLVVDKAQNMMSMKSGNIAIPNFLREFGKPAPTVQRPHPQIKDGIEYPVKFVAPTYNVVTQYAKAMARTRRKFNTKKGVNKYILDSLDAFVVSGHPVILPVVNQHKKRSSRTAINPRAVGLTMMPTYIMKLAPAVEDWHDVKTSEWKNARHADVANAAHMLKAGAKLVYTSFLDRAKKVEQKRLYAAHMKEVELAKKAIVEKYTKDSDSRTFHNVQMLPGTAIDKLNADKTAVVKPKTDNEVRKEAKEAAAKWVLENSKSTKNLVTEEIKKTELSHKVGRHDRRCVFKSSGKFKGQRFCTAPGQKNTDLSPLEMEACCINDEPNPKNKNSCCN